MKTLKEQLNESLSSKEVKTLKQLGFKQYVEDKETWFETLIDNRLIRITQEEVGKDDWWNVKVKSDYLLDVDKKPMTFPTPQEAAEEVIQQINDKLI
jgi:hypothetical protein